MDEVFFDGYQVAIDFFSGGALAFDSIIGLPFRKREKMDMPTENVFSISSKIFSADTAKCNLNIKARRWKTSTHKKLEGWLVIEIQASR